MQRCQGDSDSSGAIRIRGRLRGRGSSLWPSGSSDARDVHGSHTHQPLLRNNNGWRPTGGTESIRWSLATASPPEKFAGNPVGVETHLLTSMCRRRHRYKRCAASGRRKEARRRRGRACATGSGRIAVKIVVASLAAGRPMHRQTSHRRRTGRPRARVGLSLSRWAGTRRPRSSPLIHQLSTVLT